MATAAFVLSGKRESFLLAGLLAVSGAVAVAYGLVRTEFLVAATFPGPVFGVIIGLPVLGLGVAKDAASALRGRSLTGNPRW